MSICQKAKNIATEAVYKWWDWTGMERNDDAVFFAVFKFMGSMLVAIVILFPPVLWFLERVIPIVGGILRPWYRFWLG